MDAKQLTDMAARNTKAKDKDKDKDKPYKLAAGAGLYLHVMPKGAKYWRMKCRWDGKEKPRAIRVYPEVSLKEAGEVPTKEMDGRNDT